MHWGTVVNAHSGATAQTTSYMHTHSYKTQQIPHAQQIHQTFSIIFFLFFFFFFLSKTLINHIWIKRKLSLYDKTWFNLISLSSFGTVGRYVRDIKILGYQQLQFGIYHYFIFSGEFEYRIASWSSIICRRNETKRSTLVNTKIASNMKKKFR